MERKLVTELRQNKETEEKGKNEGNEGNHKDGSIRSALVDTLKRLESNVVSRYIHVCSTYPTEVIPPKWKEKLGNSEKIISPTF